LLGEVSRDQRQRLGGWAFHQLGTFLAYKASAAGVQLVLVDPAHTSQTCPVCGCLDRRNRPTQARFACVACGFAGHADHVAAVNVAVRGRAAVMQPHASPPTGVDASRLL
jgi:transposase